MNEELKRCPFCKGRAKISSCVSKMYIKCKICGAQFVISYTKNAKAYLIKVWNRRD